MKYETVAAASGPGSLPVTLFNMRPIFLPERNFQIDFHHMVKVTFACGILATWIGLSLKLLEIFLKFVLIDSKYAYVIGKGG